MNNQNTVYAKHDKAFALVKSFVIVKDGVQKGVLNIKYPRDGMGRLTVYLHLFGTPMVSGHCSGCGYDKVGTSLASIAREQKKKGIESEEHQKFYNDLESCNSGFDYHAVYGGYTFLRAI